MNRQKRFVFALLQMVTLCTGLAAGTWTPLSYPPTFLKGVGAPLLLTDGSVLVQEQYFDVPSELTSANNAYGYIYKLMPDMQGSYVNGTWSKLEALPMLDGEQYAPVYYASAVLADGRVLFMGGEANGLNNFNWQSKGAIYDPVTDRWDQVLPPEFFVNSFGAPPFLPIGDASSVVLEDGTFMLQDALSGQSALLDAKNLTWKPTGFNKFGVNDEEGWVLLPNGKVLTVDCNVGLDDPRLTGSEIYDPATGSWSDAGSTVVQLSDYGDTFEIGPMVLRPDGTVVAFGGTTHTAIYDSYAGTWSAGPDYPFVGRQQQTCMDAPAALLPNGNVLVATGPNFVDPPTSIFEFTYGSNTFVGQPSTPNCSQIAEYYANMLVLPTGQVLMTDTSTDVQIYTPDDRSYDPNWAPVITCAPKKITRGKTYKIKGIRFNGMSQATGFGDDYQSATNYPLVRITNGETGHIFYARTHNHSFMGVASDREVCTSFDVPKYMESGDSILEVVANGIPSEPYYIHVK